MIAYLGCESARLMLDAALDGELAMAEQVALESHLRWCRTCAAHLDDMRFIRASIRHRSAACVGAVDKSELAAIRADVLSRIRAEHDQSLLVRVREMFDDRRLLWPVVGATAALGVCLWGALAVWNAATAVSPASLAAMIERIGNPGSNQNPMMLGDRISVPRTLSAVPGLESIPGDEVALTFAMVVTREGRIAISELLEPRDGNARRPDTAAWAEDVSAVLDAVNRARFAPAQSAEGTAVAVNMVWVIARTTAEPDIQLEALLEGRPLPHTPGVKPLKAPTAQGARATGIRKLPVVDSGGKPAPVARALPTA